MGADLIEARETSDSWIKAVFAQASLGMAVTDMEGRFMEVNDAFLAITRRTREELQGVSYISITHPNDRDENIKVVRQVLAGEVRSGTIRKRYLHPDGGLVWVRASIALVRDHDLVPVGFVSVLEDITEYVEGERRQGEADAALRRSESRQRLLVQISDALRGLTDASAIVQAACETTGRYFSVSRCAYAEVHDEAGRLEVMSDYVNGVPSIAGDYVLRKFGPELAAEFAQGAPIAIWDTSTHETTKRRFRQLFKPVGIRSFIGIPLKKEGKLVSLFGVHHNVPRTWYPDEIDLLRDIGERVWDAVERAKAERALRSSELRLRRVLEAATIGVIVNDSTGQFIYANPPLLQMLGYTKDDVAQRRLRWADIQAPARRVSDDLALDQLRLTGSCEPYETEYVRSDGTTVPVYVGAAFVPGDSGEGVLGTAFVTDLTTLKAAERDLIDLTEELDERVRDRTADLERANEEMSAFTYHVAHDLRAPLRAIIATSRILQEDYGDQIPEHATKLLERQAANASKLGVLIDELLKLSRLAREEAHARPLDLTAIAEDVATEHAVDNQLVSLSVDLGMKAFGDPHLVRLLLSNLIANAMRYSPGGGKVTIGRERTERGFAFYVRDEGIGFDMQYADKLFLPFERLVTESEFPGTGVGLANVARIVAKHHGAVWAESEPGHGSTFYFTLG